MPPQAPGLATSITQYSEPSKLWKHRIIHGFRVHRGSLLVWYGILWYGTCMAPVIMLINMYCGKTTEVNVFFRFFFSPMPPMSAHGQLTTFYKYPPARFASENYPILFIAGVELPWAKYIR